jgi:hypothetical protein
MQKQYKFYIQNGKAIVHPIGGGNIGPIQAHRDVRAVSIQAQSGKVIVTYEDGAVVEHPWPNTGGLVVYLVQPQKNISSQKPQSRKDTSLHDDDDYDDDDDDHQSSAFEYGNPPLLSPNSGPLSYDSQTNGPILSSGPTLGPSPTAAPASSPSRTVRTDESSNLWRILGGIFIWAIVFGCAWYTYSAVSHFSYKTPLFLVCATAIGVCASKMFSDIAGRFLEILLVIAFIAGLLIGVYYLFKLK